MFWRIYIIVTLLISGISFVSLNIKKLSERLKDKKIKNKINVMIPPPNTGQYCIEIKSKQFLKVNNSRHNEPMFTGIQMISVVSFTFGFVLSLIFSSLIIDPRKIFLYQTMILEPLLMKVIIPIIYLLFRKDVRSFIYKTYYPYIPLRKKKITTNPWSIISNGPTRSFKKLPTDLHRSAMDPKWTLNHNLAQTHSYYSQT